MRGSCRAGCSSGKWQLHQREFPFLAHKRIGFGGGSASREGREGISREQA
jgi:hypothetical protein